jgi:hypothetical protein
MNELQIKAVLAGVFFGIRPLLMNRSGLNGNVSSAVFSLACLVGTMPFALRSMGNSLMTANWPIIAAQFWRHSYSFELEAYCPAGSNVFTCFTDGAFLFLIELGLKIW